jgi:hypothetical protein
MFIRIKEFPLNSINCVSNCKSSFILRKEARHDPYRAEDCAGPKTNHNMGQGKNKSLPGAEILFFILQPVTSLNLFSICNKFRSKHFWRIQICINDINFFAFSFKYVDSGRLIYHNFFAIESVESARR